MKRSFATLLRKKLTTIQNLKEIPSFVDEAEEHAFWATHTFSDALWDQAEPFGTDELPPPRPASMPVVIPLDEATFKRVKALARRRQQTYQTLLAEFIAVHLAEVERQTE